jgi:deferrochelatase/peroxidase EfeB
MAANINAPIPWETAAGDDLTMLDELQPNIIRAHVRDNLSVLFLQFTDQTQARAFLVALEQQLMKSALSHLNEVKQFKTTGTPGTPYVGVGLSKPGYDALGITGTPQDSSFQRGMKDPATKLELADPPLSVWESSYRQDIHAIVLIGDSNDAAVATRREEVLALLPASVTVIGEETGLSLRNDHGDGIEHFGYIDGRSQPLFLIEDINDERHSGDGANVWDPAFALNRVLTPDPAAPDPGVHFGSYLIYRKLEQNVRRFKQAEEDLADALGLIGDDRARAGAMLVGRFKDGTPLTLQHNEGAHKPVMNNFTYDSDMRGAKCPFQGHIRKTNPRGSGLFQPSANERIHLMARRGQTYGERLDDPNDDSVPPALRPTRDVGLLFMAFNANINIQDDFGLSQFDFTQSSWANFPGFPGIPMGVTAPAPGLDPVIGQGARPPQTYVNEWAGSAATQVTAIPQAVNLRGGEYFFMPALAFLRSL